MIKQQLKQILTTKTDRTRKESRGMIVQVKSQVVLWKHVAYLNVSETVPGNKSHYLYLC